MKIKSIFLFIWGFLTAGSVFAQGLENNAGFVNLYDDNNGTAYISQGTDSCGNSAIPATAYVFPQFGGALFGGTQFGGSNMEGARCTGARLNTLSRTAFVLDSLMNADWRPAGGNSFWDPLKSGTIVFLSDFDFGQIEVVGGDTVCAVNHTPLKFKPNYGEISGNGFDVKNVCYTEIIDYSVDRVLDTIGFFKELDSVNVHNLVLKNFRFTIKGPDAASSVTPKASYFGPVGGLAGVMTRSLLYDDTLDNVRISAPMAGGLVGYLENSTFLRIFSNDDLIIYNEVDLGDADDYAGGNLTGWGSGYRAYLGGLVAYAVNLNLQDINVISRVQNLSADTSTVVGGLVGMYVLSRRKNNIPEIDSMKIENVTMLKKPLKDRVYTKIFSGKTMGGLIGEVAPYMNQADEIMDLSVNNVAFYGSINRSQGSVVHLGGLIGRSALDGGAKFKISNVDVTPNIKDSLTKADFYEYYSGGLIGEQTCVSTKNEVTSESFVSISNSQTSGPLVLVKKPDVENISANVFMGGFAGSACLARHADALVDNISSMEIKVAISGLQGHTAGGSEVAAIDSLMVGGFVGKAVTRPNTIGSYTDGDSVLTVRNALFNGRVSVTDSLNIVRMGGIFGSFADNAGVLYVAFENVQLDNPSLLALNAGVDPTFPVEGSAVVGGLCGYCVMPNKVDHVAIIGDFNVDGDFSQADSLYVGGVFGRLLSSKGFAMENVYHIGTIHPIPGRNLTNDVHEGYLVGLLTLNGTKVFRKIISTYHNGEDALDAFGKFEGGNAKYLSSAQGDDWSLIENECSGKTKLNGNATCWDVRYNVRNGESEAVNENFNGTKIVASMKMDEFADFLNEPFAENGVEYWARKDGLNDDFPYLLAKPIVTILPSSSSIAVSSSSSVPESSCSFWFPTFSSSSFWFPTFSSSSFQFPTFSSSSITWPWLLSSSSIELPPLVSSSSLFFPPSSSEFVPVVSSSSELPLPVSSSSFERPVSSSALVIIRVPALKIESHKIEWAGSMARLKFNASVDSLAGKVALSVRVLSGVSTLVDTLLLDSVPGSVRGASVTFGVNLGDSVVYEIALRGDLDSAFVYGGSWNETRVQRSHWQMVSLADVDLRKLHLDEYHVLYSWDEALEMGDYLQYRAYSRSDEVSGMTGYWYGSYDGVPLKRKVAKYVDNAEIVWNVDSINSGWNMVANPYSWNVDLSAIENSGIEMWSWNVESGEYEIPTELQPYEAIWVQVHGSQTIQFPATPKFEKGTTKSLAKVSALKKSSDGWTIRAILTDDYGKKDSWNLFGTNSEVSKSDEPPSGMGDHVSLSIVEEGRALARSFRPAAEEMEWTLQLSASSERTAYLKLEGLAEAKSTGNKVFVTVDGKTVEAKEGKTIPVKVGPLKKTAVVRVAPQAKPEVEYAFKDVRFYRSGSAVNVQFVATNGLAGRNAKVELLDISGKVIASLSAVSVDGKNSVKFPAPEGGLYILRIRSGSQNYAQKVVLR